MINKALGNPKKRGKIGTTFIHCASCNEEILYRGGIHKYCSECFRKRRNAHQVENYRKNPKKCIIQVTESRKKHWPEWLSYQRKYARIRNKKIRLKVLNHYSKGIPSCACCGEKTIEFLSIHHINGGGAKHKKSLSGHLYDWIIRENYPAGFQILCHNCNQAKGYYGYCPHNKDGERMR